MIRVGIAGVGFMGWIHYLAYQRVEGVEVAAICTRDKKKLAGDWTSIRGNFGPPGEQIDVAAMARYSNLRKMLADPQLDLIDICLPPDMHASAALSALKKGKHVFCEKPMALTTAACRRMVGAAEQAGKQLLIGHVLPMFPEYAEAIRQIQSGRHGQLLGGHFKRVISDPLWLSDFYDPRRIGGPLVDLHVHDAHLIRMLFGMPTSVISRGRMRGDVVEYCNTMFSFADPKLTVSAASGVINQQGRPFTHGFEIHLEKATMTYEFAVIGQQAETLMRLTILDDQGGVLRPTLPAGDEITAFEAEISEVRDAIRSGRSSQLLGADLAHDAIVLCHKQTQSVKRGRSVKVS